MTLELEGLEKVRERRANGVISTLFTIKCFESDLRAIEAELKEAMKGRGHTYSRDAANGEYYMNMTTINHLISAIHSATEESDK